MTISDISIKQLNIHFKSKYGDVKGVKDTDMTFRHGEVTGIIGESGSGKSLLGMSILKLLPSEARITGQCIYGDNNLYEMDKKGLGNLRGREIAFVPQNPFKALNPVLTIERQLVEHTMLHLNLGRKEAKRLSLAYLQSFGLKEAEKIMKSYSFQLSGGMNQVVLFVMGIICKPSFVIADEPTKGLDSKIRKNVYDRLLHIKRNHVESMIIITHDLYFAQKLCDTIAVMYRGELVEIGDSHDVIKYPKHPYTQSLVKSTVKNGMIPIKKIDDRSNLGGCSYYAYCVKRSDKCLNAVHLRAVDHSKVRCLL